MGALIGGGIATLLSLCILSRALADNPFYRFAQSLLVGTALGYVTAVLVRSSIIPILEAMVFGRASTAEWVVGIGGLLLGLLLVTRFGRQRGSHWANYPLALLFGAGAALALLGALRGTLLPQLLATVRLGSLTGDISAQIGAMVLALLTITTLLAFTYTSSRPSTDPQGGLGDTRRPLRDVGPGLARTFRAIGRLLILATFGVFFAATVTTYIAALIGQVEAIADWLVAVWTVLTGP